MPKQIEDLRNHLFETLSALRDKEHPLELDRARAIADVAKVIVESAKVEVDFLKVTGATKSTDFLPIGEDGPAPARALPSGTGVSMPPPQPVRSVRHGTSEFDVAFDGGKGQSLIGDRVSVGRR